MTLPREASPTFDRALTIPCFQDRRDSKKTYRERSMPIFLRITIEIIKQIYIYIFLESQIRESSFLSSKQPDTSQRVTRL